MNRTFKVAIIGGGSSGLFCATKLLLSEKFQGQDILLIEGTDRVGKKLVASGNGQGNLSSLNLSADNYHGDKGFIRAFLSKYSFDELKEFYSQVGVYLTSDNEGRVYPASFNASSVLDNIRAFLTSKNLFITTQTKVLDVKYKNLFEIKTNNGIYYAENCVMAFGGKSGKQFGTDGSSYKLCENFDHKLTELYPSLVQLKTETDFLKGLKGIKERVKITAYDNDKPIKTIEGDLLFTDYGVSGDAVFKISSYVSGVKNASISIEFLPNLSKAEIVNLIESKRKLTYIAVNEILNGLVNKRTGYNLIRYAKDNSANSLANVLKDFRLKVIGTAGFDMSQVTKGGIDTDSINPFTFRSKLQKNLYLIGELLNVDGDCGGYNLTFAYISGIFSANDIIEKY